MSAPKVTKNMLERQKEAALHLAEARAIHIERLKEEIKIKDAVIAMSEAYITYMAGEQGEVRIPKKDLAQFVSKNTVHCDVDDDYYIIKIVAKEAPVDGRNQGQE